jgi:hypothetical protein
MFAGLKPRATIASAQSRLDAVDRHHLENAGRLRKLLEDARFRSVVTGLKEQMTEDVRPTLYLLQAAVTLVLLIGA